MMGFAKRAQPILRATGFGQVRRSGMPGSFQLGIFDWRGEHVTMTEGQPLNTRDQPQSTVGRYRQVDGIGSASRASQAACLSAGVTSKPTRGKRKFTLPTEGSSCRTIISSGVQARMFPNTGLP